MAQDDLVIGSLRIVSRRLQELVHYLEEREGLSPTDGSYCREQVMQTMRQLKVFERLLDRQASFPRLRGRLSWN